MSSSDSDKESLAEQPEKFVEQESEEPQEKALSHKERRKQRRAEALAKDKPEADTEQSTEQAEDPEKTEKVESRPQRSAYAVWIGNLSFKTTRERLFEWISTNIQESEDVITRINMPKGQRAHEHNKGFAYIDITTEDIMNKVIAQSENNLDGRKLLIKSANDFGGRPKPQLPEGVSNENDLSKFSKKILSSQQNKPNPTLFFGNLSFETTEESIKSWLISNAEKLHTRQKQQQKIDQENKLDVGVKRIRLGTFPDSGKCKGWCFIDFKNTTQATSALCDSHNHRMYGRDLVVQFGQDRSEQKKRKYDKEAEKEDTNERPDNRKPKRAKPGAALANAQRSEKASGAINQPSAGTKITFD